MWKCANCGEEENEDSYKFCLTCGSPLLDFGSPAPTSTRDMDVDVAFSIFSDPVPSPSSSGASLAVQQAPPARPAKFPQSLKNLGRKMKDALPLHNGHLNHVKLSPQAQDKLNQLVQAGVFNTKAKAAAYLIERGIQSEAGLFDVIQQKLAEIERIEQELRNLVKVERV